MFCFDVKFKWSCCFQDLTKSLQSTLELKSKTKQEGAEDTVMCWDDSHLTVSCSLQFIIYIWGHCHQPGVNLSGETTQLSEGRWMTGPGKKYYWQGRGHGGLPKWEIDTALFNMLYDFFLFLFLIKFCFYLSMSDLRYRPCHWCDWTCFQSELEQMIPHFLSYNQVCPASPCLLPPPWLRCT